MRNEVSRRKIESQPQNAVEINDSVEMKDFLHLGPPFPFSPSL